MAPVHDSIRACALAVVLECDPDRKCAATADLAARVLADQPDHTALQIGAPDIVSLPAPGRPARPELVAPRLLAQRKLGTPEGRAVLLHAVAHIEFNAINLAWDAVYRFGDLPWQYYADWASVAADEARHFQLVRGRLRELGCDYGAFGAHDGLWQMAVATEDCLRARMALVPRLLEARGLDVTPGMIEKLRHVGDHASIAMLEVILREEVRHVDIGSRWFRHACMRDGIADSEAEFLSLLATRASGRVRPPFNLAARKLAGFSDLEMARLTAGV